MYSEAEEYNSKIAEAVMQSPGLQHYLSPGRVVIVKSESVSSRSQLLPSGESCYFNLSGLFRPLVIFQAHLEIFMILSLF